MSVSVLRVKTPLTGVSDLPKSPKIPADINKLLHSAVLQIMSVLTLVLLTGSQPLLAAETTFKRFNIGGKALNLAIPASYCLMDKNNPADKMALSALTKSLAGRNELIAQYTNCKELTNWRAGTNKDLSHKGAYQVSAKLKSIDLTGKETATVQNICKFISSKSPDFATAASELESNFNEIPLNQGKKLGISLNEDNLCVAVSVLRLEDTSKNITGQISLYATSVINGRLLYTYLYAPGHKLDEIIQLTEQMKTIHHQNVKANQ